MRTSFFTSHNLTKKQVQYLFLRISVICVVGIYSAFILEKHLQTHIHTTYHQPIEPFLYVDASSRNAQNGSFLYPFATIEQALEFTTEHPHFTTLIIAPGTYTENITLPSNMHLLGMDKESPPIIHSDPKSSNNAVITASQNNLLYKIKARGGKYGVYLPTDSSINILHSTLTSNRKYGFYNEDSSQETLPQIRILSSEISHNGKQGAYVQTSNLSVHNSLFKDNGEEGLDLHVGMTAHIRESIFRNNGESGIETEIGNNTLLIENNILKNNTKNGINVQSTEERGDIRLIRNTMIGNQKFGLRCAIHSSKSSDYFSTTVTRKFNTYLHNSRENIDPNCAF